MKKSIVAMTLFLSILFVSFSAFAQGDIQDRTTQAIISNPAKGYKVKDPFKDISPNSPYYEMLHYLRDQGIISGYEDGTFRPNETISRKHLAALVNRSTSNKGYYVGIKDYSDIPKNHPYYSDIRAFREAGVFDLKENAQFYPDKKATRAEAVNALWIMLEIKTNTYANRFKDVTDQTAYNPSINVLENFGIVTGDNGYFYPEKELTRSHFAILLYRALNTKTPSEILDERVKLDLLQYKEIEDVPKPKNYSASFLKNQQSTAYIKSREKQFWNGNGAFTLFSRFSSSQERIEVFGLRFGRTYEEMVAIINKVMKTGEVHIDNEFVLYYNFDEGRIYYID